MRTRRLLVASGVAVVVLAATAAVVAYARAEAAGRRVADLFDGEAGLKTVTAADEVVAYRLAPLPVERQGRRTPLDEFEVLAGPVPLPAEHAGRVARALSSPGSYGWDYAKGCVPIYGVRFSFVRGGDRVDVLLCLQCDVLLVYRNGEIAGGEDFDPIRPILVRAAKAAFPDDEVIAGLKERD